MAMDSEIIIFRAVAVHSLVDRYQHFGDIAQLDYLGITSQRTETQFRDFYL
jgi:hypothetical protein